MLKKTLEVETNQRWHSVIIAVHGVVPSLAAKTEETGVFLCLLTEQEFCVSSTNMKIETTTKTMGYLEFGH